MLIFHSSCHPKIFFNCLIYYKEKNMEHKTTNAEMDELLFHCLEGVASDAEYEQAWRWVHQSPQNKACYDTLRDAWIAAEMLKPVDTVRQQQIWSQLEKKMLPAKLRIKTVRMKYWRWAAAAAVIVSAYFLGTQIPARQGSMEIAKSSYIIEVPKGGKSVMTLSDGSRVWLNAGSSLHFDPLFGEKNRTLVLQGEAYFEVARDTKRLFQVETSGITIAALGTAFNVKAYPDDDLIETTLVEGSVRIETNAQSKTKIDPMVLKPNQKAVFYKSRQSVSVDVKDTISPVHSLSPKALAIQSFHKIEVAQNVDVEITTSWKDKRWIVQSESIGTLAAKIERRYDVELVFENAELKKYKISATLEEETIEQLLNAIRLTVPMDYRIERNQVFLKINPKLKKEYDRLIQNK